MAVRLICSITKPSYSILAFASYLKIPIEFSLTDNSLVFKDDKHVNATLRGLDSNNLASNLLKSLSDFWLSRI